MKSQLIATRRLFVASIVSLAVVSVLALGAVLYATGTIRFNRQEVSPTRIQQLTSGYPEVAQYLAEQKQSEAHFVKIANLVKNDQQRLLGRALLLALLPTLLFAGLAGYFLARRLLKPIEAAYVSKERFLQDAAHEMRNPLAAMSAVIQQTKGARSKNLETLERQTRHLIKLNEDLLLLEKIRDHRLAKSIDATNLLNDIVDSLRPVAQRHGLKLRVSAKPGVKLKIQDSDFISVARNLIENAIKYSRRTAKAVDVKLHSGRTYVELVVKDRGIGIPADELMLVGERFYRASNVGNIDGTGLGLALVDLIVTSYSGRVSYASQPDRGTTVTVRFKT